MPAYKQQVRQSTSVASTFIGAVGVIIVDTGSFTLRIHDGVTPGGWALPTLAGLVASYAPLASPVFSGVPTVPTQIDPTNNTLQIANTAFVQSALLLVNNTLATDVATTAAGDTSAMSYANGAGNNGVGATLTGVVNTAVTIDGFTFNTLGQRVLVKNDTQTSGGATAGAFNGVYQVTQLQGGGLAPVFTRVNNFNQPANINYSSAVAVKSGTVNAGSLWVCTSVISGVGTAAINFGEFPNVVSNQKVGGTLTVVGAATFAAVGAQATTVTSLNVTASSAITVNGATITFQGSDTYIGRATVDTLTNKTFDTAGAGNSFKIAGTAITANTATGSNVLANTPTLITPILGVATATSINGLTISASTGTLSITNLKTVSHTSSTTFAGVDGKTLTTNNSIIIAGTDGKTITVTNSIGLAGVDGKVITTNNSLILASSVGDGKTLDIGGGAALSQSVGPVALSSASYTAAIVNMASLAAGVYLVWIAATGGSGNRNACLVYLDSVGGSFAIWLNDGAVFQVSGNDLQAKPAATTTYNVYYSQLCVGVAH